VLELRDYQIAGIAAIRDALRRHRRVLYTAPCGAGKGCMIAFMVKGALAKGKRVCLTVHRRELVMDLSGRLDAIGVPHHLIVPGSKPERAQVNVASVQTWVRRLDVYKDFDFILVDEGHHCINGNSWGRCLEANPQAKVVSFTASPERLDGRGLDDNFDELVIGPGVRELIGQGWLADYVCYSHPSSPDTRALKTRMGDFETKGLEAEMMRGQLLGDVPAHYAKHVAPRPAIAFAVSIAHAEALAAEFRQAGWRAESVDGTMSDVERARRINGLSNGEVQVLVSCELVGEGLDIPQVSGTILCRPTQSLAVFVQQIGRCLRPKPDGGKAIILDHAGNVARHGLPDTPRDWQLHRPKRKPADRTNIRTCRVCFATFPASLRACPECDTPVPLAEPKAPPRTANGELVEITSWLHVDRSREGIAEAVRQCRDWRELKALGKYLGFKSGWPYHAARERGWRPIVNGMGYTTKFVPPRAGYGSGG
jgi:DNA repair protein RadD